MPRARKRRRMRTWPPRPSQKAQARILAAFRELIGRLDWTSGTAVDLASLLDMLTPEHFSPFSLRHYVAWMGHDLPGRPLRRIFRGVYELRTAGVP